MDIKEQIANWLEHNSHSDPFFKRMPLSHAQWIADIFLELPNIKKALSLLELYNKGVLVKLAQEQDNSPCNNCSMKDNYCTRGCSDFAEYNRQKAWLKINTSRKY